MLPLCLVIENSIDIPVDSGHRKLLLDAVVLVPQGGGTVLVVLGEQIVDG